MKKTPSGFLDMDIKCKASSIWNAKNSADKALNGSGGYWSSSNYPELPLFWWVYSEKQPLEIVSISFEEKYEGAEFEFFGSETKGCGKEGKTLISGPQRWINGKYFLNGQSFYCYGLKVTKLAKLVVGVGKVATVKNFHFIIKGRS